MSDAETLAVAILREKRMAVAQEMDRIDKAIALFEGTLATGKPRKFSEKARARMAEAQRRRWALAKAREGAA